MSKNDKAKKGEIVKISPSDLAMFGDWYNKARTALDRAASIDEVREIKNRAEAVRIYALKAGDRKLREQAVEIGLWADFSGKELAKQMRERGELAAKEKGRPGKCSTTATLPQIGVSRKQSMQWGHLAPVKKAEFEQAIEKVRGSSELTKAAVLREVVQVPERTAKQEKIAREAKAGGKDLPAGTLFPVIIADCPWKYDFAETESRAIENNYPTMTCEQLCGLRAELEATVFAKDAVMFFWATAPKLRDAFRVVEAWGFEYVTNAVWDKLKIGMGYWFRGQHEHLLVAKRGNFMAPTSEARVSSVIRSPRLAHSQKPTAVYEIVMNMFPKLPVIELFARTEHEGVVAWGNQLN